MKKAPDYDVEKYFWDPKTGYVTDMLHVKCEGLPFARILSSKTPPSLCFVACAAEVLASFRRLMTSPLKR